MGKLTRLKEWVTLTEACAHLSEQTGATVSDADILQLALEGKLTLSIRFQASAHGRAGELVDAEQARWSDVPFEKDRKLRIYDGLALSNGKVIQHSSDKAVVRLDGIWDLPLVVGDRTYVQNELQRHIQFDAESLIDLDGCYVVGTNGVYYQLQDKLSSGRNPDPEGPFWKIEWYPAGGFPEGATLVLRPSELERVEALLQTPQPVEREGPPKPSTRERESMLKLIIGMAIDGYGYDVKARRSPLSAELSRALQRLGIPLSDDTIRGFLTTASELLPK